MASMFRKHSLNLGEAPVDNHLGAKLVHDDGLTENEQDIFQGMLDSESHVKHKKRLKIQDLMFHPYFFGVI
jgi:hypothetical protein